MTIHWRYNNLKIVLHVTLQCSFIRLTLCFSHVLSCLMSVLCQSFSTVHKVGPDFSMYFYRLERAGVLAFVYISYQATVYICIDYMAALMGRGG